MELTKENLYSLLDSTEYTLEKIKNASVSTAITAEKFNTKDYNELIKNLLDSFFPGQETKMDFHVRDRSLPLYGGLCHSEYNSKIFKDVTKITFHHFYPHITIKLSEGEYINNHKDIDPFNEENWEDDVTLFGKKITWSIKEFPLLYKFLLESYSYINSLENERVKTLLRVVINMTFGIMANKYQIGYISCDGYENVTITGRMILQNFLNKFPNHVFYLDTDEMYFSAFDEIKEEVIEILKEIDITYEIQNIPYMFLLRKKQFITWQDENFKTRGFSKTDIIENMRIRKEHIEVLRRKQEESMRRRAEEANDWQ